MTPLAPSLPPYPEAFLTLCSRSTLPFQLLLSACWQTCSPSLFLEAGPEVLGPVSQGCLRWAISGLACVITVFLSSHSPCTSLLSASLSSFLGGGGSFLLELLKFGGFLSKLGSSLHVLGCAFFLSC